MTSLKLQISDYTRLQCHVINVLWAGVRGVTSGGAGGRPPPQFQNWGA